MAYSTKDYSDRYQNDQRLTDVKAEEKTELSDLEQAEADALAGTDKFVTDQKNAIATARDEAIKNQQANTDFAIEKIEQQKEQSRKDYIKEQSGAYVDWQKQSDPYGANAEHRASSGLSRSGYSESSQVSMYNTYQNRVASARSAYELVVMNYNNGIKEARLQNNVALAEIRSKAAQQQLEIALQGFQYKNQLVLDFADRKMQAKSMYLTKWKAVLDQINSEIALEEQQRQYAASHALEERQVALAEDKWAYEKEQAEAARITAGGGGDGNGGNTGVTYTIDEYTPAEGEIISSNMDDLNALGLSGRTAEYVNNLVNQGKIIRYEENGIYRYCTPDSEKGKEITAERLKKVNQGLARERARRSSSAYANWKDAQAIAEQERQAEAQAKAIEERKQKQWNEMVRFAK